MKKTLSLAIMAALLSTGCATLMQSLGMSKHTKEDVKKAYADGDQAKLEAMCAAPKSDHQFKTNKELACEYAEALPQQLERDTTYEAALAAKDLDGLKSVCVETNGADGVKHTHETYCETYWSERDTQWKALETCGEFAPFWETHYANTMDVPDERYLEMASKQVACDNWDFVFERVAHTGNRNNLGSTGTLALKHLEDEGHDVYARLMVYLKAHADSPLDFEHGKYAEMNIADWLFVTKKHEEHDTCGDFLPVAKATSYKSRFLWYFAKTGCTDAAPLLVERLASSKPTHRNQACTFLGDIGSSKHIKKMKLIADSDPEYKMDGLTKVYYIRDACSEGINKIKIRS